MKSGTTSLFRWLNGLPEVNLPAKKEIDFFSRNWSRGVGWYESHFHADGLMTGEASPSYTYPEYAATAASRIFDLYPTIRLLFTAREPMERARSHYRHEVQRGREKRSFREAVIPDSEYVTRSLYAQNLQPYLEVFNSKQLLVVRFEDLISGDEGGWPSILEFLGLGHHGLPDPNHISSVEKPQYTLLFRGLWESGALDLLRKLPRPVRRLGKWVLTSESPSYRHLMATSGDDPDREVVEMLRTDTARMASLLGRDFWVN